MPGGAPLDVPVDPTAPEARDWLVDELSKPEYAAAQPSLFDRLSQAFFEWLERLFQPGASVPTDWVPVAIVIAIVLALIVALLVWGMPRLNRRSRVAQGLFGEDDTRTADELRRSAEGFAAAGDWTNATLDRFRALARDLTERTIVFVSPGTTAHDFAGRAAEAFPDSSDRLASAARTFDDVRYLGTDGTAEQYRLLRALDVELSARTPARLESIETEPAS
ncbi:DUF4129 domain-containing protein [Mycetocola zhadangensis]|uniref:DUF4129 domain-containing protein n=1 Tax=Mycetocola zhadangensis TaxID=1164595 RepID=A0A3L7ITB4_9MICO|nr:DUF4129 domain-containing protein [Mycetocola zhadangensis]RLQ82458.1 DUF4129 domain-containing protein [Mycetocola zhadangensis]